MFALTFAGLAWFEWRGVWGWVAIGLIGVEYLITIFDSIVEDQTRVLTAIERSTHMLLAINTGLYAVFLTLQVLTRWHSQPTALAPVHYPWLSEALSFCAVAVAIWAVRDALAAHRQRLQMSAAPLPAFPSAVRAAPAARFAARRLRHRAASTL